MGEEKVERNEVQTEVMSVGLNFKDVLSAMGIIDVLDTGGTDNENNGLGCEGAGIITATGAKVQDLVPGDRIIFFGSGTFTTRYKAVEQMCVKIPDRLKFDEAATMTAVFMTVLHSLVDKARVERGMSVLVHSACGGVGIAALQVW